MDFSLISRATGQYKGYFIYQYNVYSFSVEFDFGGK